MIVLAHGVGTRTDLPIPAWLALYGSALVVLLSFLAVLALWKTPRLAGGDGGWPLPGPVQSALDRPGLRTAGQTVALLLAGLVVAVALVGPRASNLNLAPYALYVTFWVGLVPASLLLGPVWRVLTPLRLLHRGLAGLPGLRGITGRRDGRPAGRLGRLGYWPAAVGLTVFVWLELVYPERAEPGVIAVFLLGYALVQLAGALRCGPGWFDRCDAFEVYSSLLATLSPLGRRPDGRLALRNPLTGAATLPAAPGLAAVVVVLLGSTAFDGLSRTSFWLSGPGAANDTTSGTLGLAAMIAVVGVLYALGTALTGRLSGRPAAAQPGAYAHSVIPIAAGYAVAHYFSLLLLDGQTTWILASNPFGGDGVDLFGTYGRAVDYTVVSTAVIALVQVGAVVLGHALGVLLAHDRALRAEGAGRVHASDQAPLVAVMVGFTVGGLGLLLSA